MSNLLGMGGGQKVATQATRYNGIQAQASQYGMGLPIVYGQRRIAGTLIWYGDFQSIENTQSVGKGGGSITSYTYSSSFQLALCEGPITGLATIWKNSGTTTLGDINGTFSAGASNQAAWSHLSGAAALQYPNTAWVGCVNIALGSSPTVPNFNFEVQGLLQWNAGIQGYGSGIVDANPAAILTDLLTSVSHGIGFQYLDGALTQYNNYCLANNIFLSLVVSQETTMNEVLTQLLQITNSTTAWRNGLLTVIPYGDQSATANGVTYTPATTVQKSFTDSDYIKSVKVDRKPLADLPNAVKVEFLNRSNNYNATPAEAKDTADIDSTAAIRQLKTVQGHAITNGTLAQWVAQTLLQRALYIRNTYTFSTTMENIAVEPGDVIALTDSQVQLVAEPVRIVSISEQASNELQFVCEEFPAGVASGATQAVEANAGYVPNVNGAPDATQPPVIFRGPQFLLNGIPEVWIGVGGAGPNWGGANVLVSLDNVSYQQVGTVSPGCRYGAVTAALADSSADPDTVDSFSVALDAGGTLSGGTTAEADNMATLMLVDTELVSYASTVLNGDGTYTLGNGYLRRGCYATAIAAHSIGAPWIRVDDSVFRWQVDPSWVGLTVYIKIQPWNLYGGGLVSESSLTPITYVVGTAEEIPDTPPTPMSLAATGAANGNMLSWVTPNPAAVAITSIEYATVSTGPWTVLGQVQGTHFVHTFAGPATYFYRVRARSPAVIWSAYSSTVSALGGTLDNVGDGSTYVRLSGANAAGNVAYNFKGVWSSATAYVKGVEVVYGPSYWLAVLGSTNSQPAIGNANWQVVGSYSGYQGDWLSTTSYIAGAEVTYSGNFWVCVTANLNSAPTTSNANWQIAGPTSLDNINDGVTYGRPWLSRLNGGRPWIDFSENIHANKNLANVADGTGRYAVTNAGSLNGVYSVDGNNRALIDFTQTGHIGRTLLNIPDGTGRFAVTNAGSLNGVSFVDTNNRALIDFTQSAHVGRILDNIPDGTTYARSLASRLASGVSYTLQGAWVSTTAYLKGDYATVGGNIYLCIAANTNFTPPNATYWQLVGPSTLDSVANGSSYGRTYLGGLTGGYAAKTGASGTYSIKGVGDASTLNLDSEIVDGSTHGRTLLTALTSGQVDMSKAGVIGRTLINIVDANGRYAVTNAGSMNGVSAVDSANKALIDFSQAGHTNKILDNIGDGSTYARPLASRLSGGVPYTFQGIWSSTTAYKIGDQATIGGNFYLCVAANTNQSPPNTTYWKLIGPLTLDNLGDGTTYGRTQLGGLSGGYAAKTGAAGVYSIKGVGDAQTLNLDSEVVDGTTHGRTLLTALTSGQVDMSKAGVINRTGAYISYTSGGTVDSLKPAQVGADVTSTNPQPRNWLSYGTDGTNTVMNPEFLGGSSTGWLLNSLASVIAAASAPGTCPTQYCAKIPTQNSSWHTDCYSGTNVGGYIRVKPGQQVHCSMMYATDSTFNGSVVAGMLWVGSDGVTNLSWTHNIVISGAASQPWTSIEWYETAPASAVYGRAFFSNFGVSSGAAGAWYLTLARVGGMTGQANTTKGDIANTGSIPPGASTVAISYTSTTTSITVKWAAGTIYRMDGTSVSVTAGSQAVTGLTAGTLYNFGVYYDELSASMAILTGGTGAVGSPAAAYTSQAAVNTAAIYGQTNAPFGWYQFATPASGTGGGGGSGGCCLLGSQRVDLADGSVKLARELKVGDLLPSPEGATPVVKLRIEDWPDWHIVHFSTNVGMTVAADHRFVDPAGDQIRACDLRLQQIVCAKGELASVEGLAHYREVDDKVLIEVGAPHVYYVMGILSHNKVMC